MNINVNDYALDQVISGSSTSLEELQNLNKALEAGSITGRETANLTTAGGAPLKVESLEKTLKIITFQENAIKLWKIIPKKAAYNTVEEFNQLSSYGSDTGGSVLEGELPQEEDSIYVRRAQLVKFYGVTKAVTHPMALVNTQPSVGNIIERTVKDGTMFILRKIDKALTRANSNVIPTEFDGLYTQHQNNDAFTSLDDYYSSEVVVDCRGARLSEGNIETAAEGIIQNYGLGTTLVAPPQVLSNFVQNFYGNKFIMPNTEAVTAGVMGQNVQSFQSQYGPIKLEWDVFMNPDTPKTTSSNATSASAPVAPVAVSITPVASDSSSQWASSDAGDYFYAVSAVNRFGESTLTVLSGTASTIASGGSVDIKFTAGTGGTYAATGYTVYRSNKGASSTSAAKFYPLFQVGTGDVSAGYDGASAGSVRDRNRIMPGTAQAFLIQNDTDCYEFAQLAPLMKMDLAIISPAYRFMVLLYGTPLLYAPKRMVRFINVGTVQ